MRSPVLGRLRSRSSGLSWVECRPRSAEVHPGSSPLVGEGLTLLDDPDAASLAVLDAHFVHIEIDGAHDAVAELLVDEGLYGRPVILGYLVMRSIVGPVGASDPPRRPAPGAARG
jgi:hypothetical protein